MSQDYFFAYLFIIKNLRVSSVYQIDKIAKFLCLSPWKRFLRQTLYVVTRNIEGLQFNSKVRY